MIETAALPIVDMTRLRSASRESRRAAARDIDRACTGAGFFYVRDRRLDRALFDQLLARARAYFGRDHEAKMADYIGLSENHSGYVPEGEEQFGEGPCDRKEAFDVNRDYPLEGGRRPLLGPNIWPDMPGFREDVLAYYAQVSNQNGGKNSLCAGGTCQGYDGDTNLPANFTPKSLMMGARYRF